MKIFRRTLFVVARTLIAGTFVISALRHLGNWNAALDEMTTLGMPRSNALLSGSILFRFVGGLSVLTGYQTRLGAALLLAFVLPAAFLGHAFWAMPAEVKPHETIEFLNNLSMAGGILFVFLAGPNPPCKFASTPLEMLPTDSIQR